MAATVVDGSLTASNWSKAKPKDFKGADLDKALAAWKPLAEKKLAEVDVPSKASVKGFEDAIKAAEDIVKHLNLCDAQLAKVAAAVKKTEGELKKQGDKLKGDDKRKYQDAASTASAMGATAAGIKKKLA